MRILFYLVLGFVIWRILKSIFVGGNTGDEIHTKDKEDQQDQSSKIRDEDIEDAKYKDIE